MCSTTEFVTYYTSKQEAKDNGFIVEVLKPVKMRQRENRESLARVLIELGETCCVVRDPVANTCAVFRTPPPTPTFLLRK